MPLQKEDKATEEVITTEVSWRKKKQEHTKLEEEKVKKSEIEQPEEHVLALVKDEKLSEKVEVKQVGKEKITEEKFEEDKVIKLKPVEFTEQTAVISEEKDKVITELVKTDNNNYN